MIDQNNWCTSEFSGINLGDQRLDSRFLEMSGNLLKNPSAPIMEASQSWREAKAAYRLFENSKLTARHISQPHKDQTIKRLEQKTDSVFFAIQDTTTFNYTYHSKKKDMGKICKSAGYKNPLTGCYAHNTLLITERALPLGLINQKIYKHALKENKSDNKKRPITEKESYRWIESLRETKRLCGDKNVVTLCDRESDIYEFFVDAEKIGAKILVRAAWDRRVMRTDTKSNERLWSYMQKQPLASNITIEVPAKNELPKRRVDLEVRFAEIEFNPPQRLPSAQLDKLQPIKLNAIWLYENSNNEERLEWMLLTNIPLKDAQEASIVGQWYKLRWQVECYHRVLKSGCNVENCRLESYDKLTKYLTLKSIIAYRLFYLTHSNRVDPELSCESVLREHEWKALYSRINKTRVIPQKPPTVREIVGMIAQLGGFAGRKGDGEPGMTPIWRGWQKLTELSEMWLIMSGETYG